MKLKCLDNDIKTKSISKTCTNYESKGKPRKKCNIPVSNPNNKNSVCVQRNGSTPKPLDHSAVDIRGVITCTVQVNRTSWLHKKTTRIFVKLQKYAFLKQNNVMRIDELPYHSSLFHKLNFVSRRQFFITIGKYPSTNANSAK